MLNSNHPDNTPILIMSESNGKVFVTWDEFSNLTLDLCDKILEKHGKKEFKGIIAVARGGYIPAAIIANSLNIKNMRSISLSTYDETNTMRDVKVNSIFKDTDTWLIIDELADSGSTFMKIREYLPNSVYAVVYSKPNGVSSTDIYAIEVQQDEWIVFPWEPESNKYLNLFYH
uniref:Phosphoribosyl transferase domain protein n=1 Tax=Pithovirus LCPAC101 TaxID=2506586 RepID=A0A481Z2Q5_9VIRU|nr:MAG: phosphoribosyl transferase domain protein [Pithovirus LCPAC101]